VTGDGLVDRVKELAREGNVRRITIWHDGRKLLEVPLTFGIVGALLAPQLAALGAIAAFVTKASITVERDVPSETVENSASNAHGVDSAL
jgi:Domain of unknown function (DUF4342)